MTDISGVMKILQDHERRIKKLEGKKSIPIAKNSTKPSITKLLIELKDAGFFNKPRFLKEIVNVLARLGYHYRPSSLTDPIRRALRKKILGRVGKAGKWQYVSR